MHLGEVASGVCDMRFFSATKEPLVFYVNYVANKRTDGITCSIQNMTSKRFWTDRFVPWKKGRGGLYLFCACVCARVLCVCVRFADITAVDFDESFC